MVTIFDMGKNFGTYRWPDMSISVNPEVIKKLIDETAELLAGMESKFNLEMLQFPCSMCGHCMSQNSRIVEVCDHQYESIKRKTKDFPDFPKWHNLFAIEIRVIRRSKT